MPQRIWKTIKGTLSRTFILLLILSALTECRGRSYPYTTRTYRSFQGWGYDILADKKVYIHQPFMPAVQGEVPFKTKESAEKCARLMIRKLQEHRVPSVTREELEKIIRE